MIYNLNTLTAEQITNLYLYGQPTKPADLSALATRPADVYGGSNGTTLLSSYQTQVNVDAELFMSTGAGRFANGSMDPLVIAFMSGKIMPSTGSYQEITLTGEDVQGITRSFGLQQYNFNDGFNDIGTRTYIYNSTGFAVAQGAKFIVEADGTRRIENYAILPRTDNFDFVSSNWAAQAGNAYLEPRVDPLGIGRSVLIVYTEASKNAITRGTYTQSDFAADNATTFTQYGMLKNNQVPTIVGLNQVFSERNSIIAQALQSTPVHLDGPTSWSFDDGNGGHIVLSTASSNSQTHFTYYNGQDLAPKDDALIINLGSAETLSKVSQEYQVPLALLEKFNPQINDFNNVAAGAQIYVPINITPPAILHGFGESLTIQAITDGPLAGQLPDIDYLAQSLGFDRVQLQAANPGVDLSNLTVNQQINLPTVTNGLTNQYNSLVMTGNSFAVLTTTSTYDAATQTWQVSDVTDNSGLGLTNGIKLNPNIADQLFQNYLSTAFNLTGLSNGNLNASFQLTNASGDVIGSQTLTKTATGSILEKYDTNHQLTYQGVFDLGGKLTQHSEIATDLNGVKTTTFYNATDAVIGFSVTSKDANGNDLIINTDAQGNILNRTTVSTLADGSSFQSIVQPNGHITEVTTSLDGTVTSHEVYTAAETLSRGLSTTLDALSLIQAIQSGNPLPIAVTGLRLASQIDVLANGGTKINDVPQINTTLAGAADIGTSILSVLSLSNALKNGDALGAVTSGAQAVGFAAKAFIEFGATNSTITDISSVLNGNGASVIGTDGSLQLGNAGAIAYLNIVNELANGDYAGAAIDTLAIVQPEFAPVAIAYHVFSMIFDLFGGDDIPAAWGNGQFHWNGSSNSVTYQAAGKTGGLEAVSAVMQQTLDFMNSVVAQQRAANPNNPLGIIPNRLPTINYGYDIGGYQFSDIDPLTGVDNHPGLTYDTNGRPFNATPGSPESFQSLPEAVIRSAIDRGAIAPQWEVDTAYLQTQHGAPYAGLSEEERAARTGHINTAAIDPAATTQTARIIGLDLDGNGIQTISEAQSDVAFDIDNSGFLKHTSWVGANDAILTLDRNANGSIDDGKELFNNTAIDLSQRGIKSLAWADSNNDGVIDNRDPVYNQLKIWQDSNSNGVIDAGENTALSYNGISQLNYTMGTYTINGQVKQMASVDLTADTQGTRTQIVPEGILIQTTDGNLSLIATKVDDESALAINQDGITGYENTELIVSSADLFANDTYTSNTGVVTPATNLRLSAIDNFNHGTAFIDNNNFIHFTPDANYSGSDAGFDYHTLSPSGLLGTGHVDVTINAVNKAPVVDSVTHNQRAIYGWQSTQIAAGFNIYGPAVAVYTPYTSYQDTAFFPIATAHNTPIAYDDAGTGQVIASDVDDPVSSLTYQIVGLPQMGGVTIDATGHFQYTDWSAPNRPSVHTYGDVEQTDAFQVRVTDPHGASVLQTVNVTHYGIYTPPAPPGGDDGGCPVAVDMDNNGFAFVPVADSSVFFDISNDGWKHRVSWTAPGDGWLAFDADHNGKIEHADEIAFAAYAPNAKTDLEGLALAFDSNHDGQFTKADDKWADFGIWVDANSNGITDPGEFKTLDDLGVASIDLQSDGQFSVNGGNTINGIAKVHMLDGTTHDAADVSLQYSDDILVPQADGSTVIAQHPKSSGSIRIDGTPDADLILAQTGPMEVYAGDGNDFVQGGAGDDYIEADNGDDVVYAGDGNDIVDGGDGNDVVFAGNGNDLVVGGNGNDALFGEAGNDIIYGGDGNDLISGGGGNDVLSGDKGDDIISGEDGNDALFGMSGNDQLSGGAGNDQLYGGEGNDLLDGGAGADNMIGGAGDDIYVVDNAGDVVTENANEGIDTVRSSITYTLGANVENLTLTGSDNLDGTGNELDNVLTGNSGNNMLIGGAGNDTLDGGAGADTMAGGTGDDTYVVDNTGDVVTENAGEGVDTVRSSITYALGANVENLTLTGSDDLNGTGNELDNVLAGNTGNNVLDGGIGADTMIGGSGNDTYIIDNVGDVVVENANGGIDTVISSITYTLGSNPENLTLTSNDNLNGTGNELNNVLIGNAGNNLLDGGAGADTLIGGAGDDTYVVDNTGDVVVENANEGTDTVLSSVTYTLSSNVENLALTGTADINATGNSLANILTGNTGNNLLDGGTGADTMLGGTGDDTYVVDNVGDVVVENAGQGIDSVLSSINYVLPDNVENLTLTGTADINATGNGLDNVIAGNSGNNLLDGNTGADTMSGGSGNDTYMVDNAGDVVVEQAAEGNDTVYASINYALTNHVENLVLTGSAVAGTGNTLDNTIIGNANDNILDGGIGADSMTGGMGNDTYIVDNVGDVVIENANEGTDSVLSSVTYTLSANVENLTLTGSDSLNGTGNDLNNVLIGNAGNNLLDGASGADSMSGGVGDDTYIVDNYGDQVIENTGEGNDTVFASINYVLPANVENLTLTGTDNLTGTGNALNNVITGNTGNNLLDGGTGADTLAGGAGDDIYVVDNVGDVVIENANKGIDTVLSSVTYTLSVNVENLTLTGTSAINGTGNELNNVLTGNAGNNVLDGGNGADTMIGGAGNDTYVVDNVGDVMVENAHEGIDTVLSSVTYTLSANVENLTLTGTGNLNGTGNKLDNVITGNIGNNTLVGGAGNDTMIGNGGNDVFDGGTGNDTLVGGSGNDTYIWRNGDGLDVISDAGGNDTVQFGAALNLNNLALRVTTDNGVSTAHLRVLDDCGCEVGNQGLDFAVSVDANGNYISPIEQFQLADGTIVHFDDLLIKTEVTKISPQTRTLVTGRNDDIIYAGSTSDTIYSGTGNDIVYATSAGDAVYGQGGDDALIGGTGADTLDGGCGNNVLAGGNGQDGLSVSDDNNLLLGGQGSDQIVVGSGNNFIAGGQQNDTITTGAGYNIIALNKQDGQDVVQAAAGAHNTLSLGGGLSYSDLSLSRSGNDLVLDANHGDGITIKNWYASTANHSFVTLQMIEEASPDYAPGGTDVLRNSKIEDFDFQKLVNSFDTARTANPNLAKWNLMNGLLDAHLVSSDNAAIGGEFAYEYGKNGSLAQVGIVAAETALKDPGFGGMQNLKPFQGVSGGATIGL
jgi:Ca2+-binding RTX toxin-like protein